MSQLGSSISVRRFLRTGSSLSIAGVSAYGSLVQLSLIDCLNLGSVISIRSISKFGFTLSCFDNMSLGSSVSIRTVGTRAQFGSDLSQLRFISIGSLLSCRSVIKI
jgi:hypothetical protein